MCCVPWGFTPDSIQSAHACTVAACQACPLSPVHSTVCIHFARPAVSHVHFCLLGIASLCIPKLLCIAHVRPAHCASCNCRHYDREIAAYDVKTLRCDVYGEGAGYRERGMVIYDGLHYDALSIAAFDNAPEEIDVSVFDPLGPQGEPAHRGALEIAKQVRSLPLPARQHLHTESNMDLEHGSRQKPGSRLLWWGCVQPGIDHADLVLHPSAMVLKAGAGANAACPGTAASAAHRSPPASDSSQSGTWAHELGKHCAGTALHSQDHSALHFIQPFPPYSFLAFLFVKKAILKP